MFHAPLLCSAATRCPRIFYLSDRLCQRIRLEAGDALLWRRAIGRQLGNSALRDREVFHPILSKPANSGVRH